MSIPVITISREYGSGGRAIGERLAKELGIPFYDKELIFMAAKESGLSEEYIKKTEQMKSTSFLYGLYMGAQQLPMNDQIFLVQSKIIRQVASEGPCVIVGRCADYALAGRPGLLRIFCRADLTHRIKRIRQRHNLSPEKAALLVAKTDRHRRVYYHHHTGKFWGHSSCYDLTVNTSVLGVEKTAEALEAYIRAFQEQD